jgi:hypothetical protein
VKPATETFWLSKTSNGSVSVPCPIPCIDTDAVAVGVQKIPLIPSQLLKTRVVSVLKENDTCALNGLPFTLPEAMKVSVPAMGPAAAVSGIKPHARRTSTGGTQMQSLCHAKSPFGRTERRQRTSKLLRNRAYRMEALFRR